MKQDTIKKLEKDTVIELQLIRHAEKHLEQDSVAFEKFIKENDQRSVEAVKLLVGLSFLLPINSSLHMILY